MHNQVVFVQQYNIFNTPQAFEEHFQMEMGVLKALGISFSCVTAAEDETTFIGQLANAQMVLCWGNPPLNKSVIESLPNLKIILRYGIGVNSVDLAAATQKGIVVYFMPDSSKEELAHHALSMILGLIRNTVYYDRKMREGIWAKAAGTEPRRIQNLTLGIFGLGNSGKALVKIVKGGFGSRVLACDPYAKKEQAQELGVQLCDFETLLKESDIISIHAPLTAQTRCIFNETAFKRMKQTALLINISRGELVHEEDLVEALIQGEIGGAGLDVFHTEPIQKDSPLLALDNVILSPHSAFYGKESTADMKDNSAKLLKLFYCQNEINPHYVANKEVLAKLTEFKVQKREETV